MPDHSCRVCYECDSQFTLFNRKHHCRLCGRVFCGTCTANSVPAPQSTDDPGTSLEEKEKIRVCNYCYKQWEKSVVENGIQISHLGLSSSPSELSLASTRSSVTGNSSNITFDSMPYTFGPYQQSQHSSSRSPLTSSLVEPNTNEMNNVAPGRSNELVTDVGDLSSGQHGISMNRLIYFFSCAFFGFKLAHLSINMRTFFLFFFSLLIDYRDRSRSSEESVNLLIYCHAICLHLLLF